VAAALVGRGSVRVRCGDVDRGLADRATALKLDSGLAVEVLTAPEGRANELLQGNAADRLVAARLCHGALGVLPFAVKEKTLIRRAVAAALSHPSSADRPAQAIQALEGVRGVRNLLHTPDE
jgi:hypothetical protein